MRINTFYWDQHFGFSYWRLFNFLSFMKTGSTMANTTSREVSPWHLRSIICKITGKISLKFWKFTFSMSKKPLYIQIFLNASEIKKFEAFEKKFCLETIQQQNCAREAWHMHIEIVFNSNSKKEFYLSA